MDPGAVLLGAPRFRQPVVARVGLRAVRLDRGRGHRGRARARRGGPPRQGHHQGARRRRPTATRPSAALDPWLGAAMSVAEATRNVSITGARPLGVTNCLNYGDPTRPEAFWQLERGRPRPGRRLSRPGPAGHRRQRVALQRIGRGADRAHGRDRRRRAASRTSTALVGPGFAARVGCGSCCSARRQPGLAGSAYAELAGAARRRRPAGARPGARSGPPGVHPRGDRPWTGRSAQDVGGGGLAVALAEAAMWGDLGARVRAAGRRLRRPWSCSARVRRGSS